MSDEAITLREDLQRVKDELARAGTFATHSIPVA